MESLQEHITKVVMDIFPLTQVDPTHSFIHDYGVDDLDVMALVMALEEEFNIAISDHDAVRCVSVEACADIIKPLLESELA